MWEHSGHFIQIQKNAEPNAIKEADTLPQRALTQRCLAACIAIIYKDRWEMAVGELLAYSRETTNASNRCTVGVIKEGRATGRLPQNFYGKNLRTR